MKIFRELRRRFRHLDDRWPGGASEGKHHGDPAGDELRERLINRILSTISNNSLLLRGEKRTGKCALLLDLRDRLKTHDDTINNYYPVYIDLQGVREDQLFATVGRAVLDQLGQGQISDAPGRLVEPGPGYGHRDLARDLRRVMRDLSVRSPKQPRLALLVNAIDTLNAFDPRINQKVRSLFMMSMAEHLVMVASAVSIDKQWEQEGSPWYNFFEEVEVPPTRRSRDRMPGDG